MQIEVHLSMESGSLAFFYSNSFSVVYMLVLRNLHVAELYFLLVNPLRDNVTHMLHDC